MTTDAARPAHVELIPATPEHQPLLANLLELYMHDFSEFHNLELGPDGRFGYKHLPLYWLDPDRHPFLLRQHGKLAGFVLVKRGSEISGNETVCGIWQSSSSFVGAAEAEQEPLPRIRCGSDSPDSGRFA
jgi:hypothetical protein